MTQVEKILLKLDKELTEKSYCNCNTEAGTIQVSEGANIWSGEVFYSVDYVELDNSEYVLHATHIRYCLTLHNLLSKKLHLTKYWPLR